MELLTFGIPSTASRVKVLMFLLVVLRLSSSNDDICTKQRTDATIEEPCSKGLQMADNGSLPCTYTQCGAGSFVSPPSCFELGSSNKYSEALLEFNAMQCYTEDTIQLGFMFSWSINKSADEVTELRVVLRYNDYPQLFDYILDIRLDQSNQGPTKSFTTSCIPFEGVDNGKYFTIQAQVLPANNHGFLILPEIQVKVECDNILIQLSSFCPAVPETRPVAKSFCDRTVSVTFTSAQPPGIGGRKTYMVEIGLFDGDNNLLEKRTLNATAADAHAPSIYFEDVKPGTYKAMFAFLDNDGIPCGNNYYSSVHSITVYDPLPVDLQLIGFCDQTIAVNLTTDVLLEQDVYNKGKVCLYEGESSNKSYSVCRTLYYSSIIEEGYHTENFLRMKPGTYHAEFVYLDERDDQCSDDAIFRSDEFRYAATECSKDHSMVILGWSLGSSSFIILVVGLILIVTYQAFQMRNHRPLSLLTSKEDDSLSGMVICGPKYDIKRMEDDFRNGDAISYPSFTPTDGFSFCPDSGLPPSVSEIQSFHDGRSRIIAV